MRVTDGQLQSTMAERSAITLGGKGFSLSARSVYTIATGIHQVRIDSSVLDRLSNQNQSSLLKSPFPVPKTLTLEETRAALTVLLNKLLLSTPSSIRTVIPFHISETLNSKPESLDLQSVDVNETENVVFGRSFASLTGICAILDHKTTALTAIIDAVAALSCETSKGDVASFGSLDSGDGYGDKEAIGVASDLKVLLNGSKLVGKIKSETILKIPKINGKLREVVKQLHSSTRIELNSGVKGNFGTGEAVGTSLSPLSVALRSLGEGCLSRAKLNLESIENESLKIIMVAKFEKDCPSSYDLKNKFKVAADALFEEDYTNFAHGVNGLLEIVWKTVAWEAVTAFFSLEGAELMKDKDIQGVDLNNADAKVDRKSEKKKKSEKKVVLGKGTSAIVLYIKDRLLNKGAIIGDNLDVLNRLVEDLLLFFDPKDPGFDCLLEKVKDIVESNESRRLPKLPKV